MLSLSFLILNTFYLLLTIMQSAVNMLPWTKTGTADFPITMEEWYYGQFIVQGCLENGSQRGGNATISLFFPHTQQYFTPQFPFKAHHSCEWSAGINRLPTEKYPQVTHLWLWITCFIWITTGPGMDLKMLQVPASWPVLNENGMANIFGYLSAVKQAQNRWVLGEIYLMWFRTFI